MRSNIAASDGKADDLSPEEINTLSDYFWTNLKKPAVDPNSRLPRTSGHRRCATVFRRRLQSSATSKPKPHEMTVGTDGDGYAGERNGGRIAKLDPTTNTFSEITPPAGVSPRVRLGAISHGNGDTLWMADAGPESSLARIQRRDRCFPFLRYSQGPQGPRQRKYDSSGSQRRRLDRQRVGNGMAGLNPKTGKWVLYESPAGKKSGKSVGPYGFSFDNKGDIWFAEYANNAVGRVDPKTGEVDDYPGAHPECRSAQSQHGRQGNIWVALARNRPASHGRSEPSRPDENLHAAGSKYRDLFALCRFEERLHLASLSERR